MKWPGQFAVVHDMFSWMLCGTRKHWEDIASKLGGSHSGFFELSAKMGKMHEHLLREAKQLYAKCGHAEKPFKVNLCSLQFCWVLVALS